MLNLRMLLNLVIILLGTLLFLVPVVVFEWLFGNIYVANISERRLYG